MNHLSEILDALEYFAQRGELAAVATLIATRGSTFRRAGARMVVGRGGRRFGSIGAGCVEAEVANAASRVIENGAPELITIRTGSDSEIYFGTGTGCDGEMTVLIEPERFHSGATIYDALAGARGNRRNVLLATAVLGASALGPVQVARAVKVGEEEARIVDGGGIAQDEMERALLAGLEADTHTFNSMLGNHIVLAERFEQCPRVLVCGAGPIAESLSRLCTGLGWEVDGIDRRASFASSENFPGARRVAAIGYGDIATLYDFDERTCAVLLTHNLLDDTATLKALLPSPIPAIFIVSSRTRVSRLYALMAENGDPVSQESLDKIHAPAGLDIGAETPEEIALAITAELMAFWSGHSSRPLREIRGRAMEIRLAH